MKLSYTARAKLDIDAAMSWYKSQSKGLEFEFLDCVEATIQQVIKTPLIYPYRYKKFRAAFIKRFPYSVFYTVKDNEILVYAVFAHRLNPTKRPL